MSQVQKLTLRFSEVKHVLLFEQILLLLLHGIQARAGLKKGKMYSQLSVVCRADTGQALILIKPKGLLAPLLPYSTPRPEQQCSCKRESRISLLNLILLKATLNIDQPWRYSRSLVLQSAGVLVPEPAWVMIGYDGPVSDPAWKSEERNCSEDNSQTTIMHADNWRPTLSGPFHEEHCTACESLFQFNDFA